MRVASRALYRGRQLAGALRPRVERDLLDEAFALLSQPERDLFLQMTLRDQQHCLDVYRALRDAGHDDAGLLAAALLHDAGKGRIALWHRVAFVMLDAAAPRLLDRLASDGGPAWPAVRGWRHALHRCRHHAELGAKLAEKAGASPRTVALIREERTEATAGPLAALHRADEGA